MLRLVRKVNLDAAFHFPSTITQPLHQMGWTDEAIYSAVPALRAVQFL